MQQRGRKSAASLSVIAGTIDGRPKAPGELTDEQRAVWDRTVRNEAAEFFKTAGVQEILAQYCRHVVTALGISVMIERMEDAKVDTVELLAAYDRLLKMRDRETRAVVTHATKLRLTNQSRYQARGAATAANKSTETRLWDRVA